MATMHDENGLSLQETAHLNVLVIRRTGWILTMLVACLLIMAWLIIRDFYNFDNQVQTTTVKQANGSEKVIISYNKSEMPSLFVYADYKDWFLLFLIIGTPIIGWELYKGQDVYRKFREWDKEFLRRAYVLIVETSIPQGKTTGEQILNLARSVFPELRYDYSRISPSLIDRIGWYLKQKGRKSYEDIIRQSTNYIVKSYPLDLALKTKNGYFIVKDFGDKIVTLKDIRQLIDAARKLASGRLIKSDVLRIICIGKEYDKSFLQRESLKQLMKKEVIPLYKRFYLDRSDFPIDLLVKEKSGYSILWVD